MKYIGAPSHIRANTAGGAPHTLSDMPQLFPSPIGVETAWANMPDASNLALTLNAAAREENTIKYMSTSRYYVSRGII